MVSCVLKNDRLKYMCIKENGLHAKKHDVHSGLNNEHNWKYPYDNLNSTNFFTLDKG